MSGLRIIIKRKAADIPPEAWASAYPKVAEGQRFFKTIDESGFEGFSFYYILVYDDTGAVVGLAPCFMIDYRIETTLEGPLKRLLTWLRGAFPKLLNLKAVICGSAACEGRIGLAGPDKNKVITAITGAMEEIAKKEGAPILAFKDLSRSYADRLDPLREIGFHKTSSYPMVELDIRFASFDEHLKTLSHATRKDLKRKFRSIGDAKIDFSVSDDVSGLLDKIHSLYLATYQRSEVQFEKVPKDFFGLISKNMPSEAKYFLWRIDGKLVAFDLCLVSSGILVDEYIGMDYSLAHKYNLYFVTFRDIITWAIENGVRQYKSGALIYEPKKRLDCRFIPTFIYTKHMNRLLNPFLGIIFSFLSPERHDPTLREMKAKGLL